LIYEFYRGVTFADYENHDIDNYQSPRLSRDCFTQLNAFEGIKKVQILWISP